MPKSLNKIWNILLNRKSKEKKILYLDAHDDIKDLICWVFWLISVGFEDMVCFIVWFFWRKIANNKKQISQNLSDKNEKKNLQNFSTTLN